MRMGADCLLWSEGEGLWGISRGWGGGTSACSSSFSPQGTSCLGQREHLPCVLRIVTLLLVPLLFPSTLVCVVHLLPALPTWSTSQRPCAGYPLVMSSQPFVP